MIGIGVSLRHLRGTTAAAAALDAYAVAGFSPDLVFDFEQEYYRTGGTETTLDGAMTFSRVSNATMVDSDGLLKWAPHNLLTYSEDFSNAAWIGISSSTQANVETAPDGSLTADRYTFNYGIWYKQQNHATVFGASYTISVWLKSVSGTQTIRLYGSDTDASPNIEVTENWQLFSHTFTATTTGSSTGAGFARDTSNSAADFYLWGAHVYRSDLGGMVNNPDRGDSYVPTTSAARYLPRRGHHIYNGTEWVNEGVLVESEARTNLLHTTNALVTQSLTVTAVPHTLHFTGTGTVTLLGASTSGPLVGTGTGENNRVSLTFTPTAASLTLAVTGTVTNAQLEVGSTPSSYIPNLAASGTVTRAADTLTVPSANLPWSSDAVSIQMQGRATGDTLTTTRWYLDANNYITQEINTSDFTFEQANAGTVDTVTGGSFTSGVNVPFNIASRHGSTFINGAVDGTALTANTTPTVLPDLSSTDLNLAFDYMGTIKLFRMWAADLGDSGIAEASTNA